MRKNKKNVAGMKNILIFAASIVKKTMSNED